MPEALDVPPLRRSELRTLRITLLHRARNRSKADVSLVEWPKNSGQKVIIKDMARCSLWFRIFIGRRMLRREWHTLRLLQDIREVPTAYCQIDADAFIIEYFPGKRVCDLNERKVAAETLTRIENLINAIHQRGIAHGDLHANNIIIAENSVDFSIIDWATAYSVKSKLRGIKKVLFNELVALDERSLAKIRMTHQPQTLSDYQRKLLIDGGSGLYRIIKDAQYFFRGLLGHQRKSRQQKIERYRRRLRRYGKLPLDEQENNNKQKENTQS